MRLFVGIFLPKGILDYLFEIQNKLKKNLDAKINWIAKKNLHLTLKFIGYVDDEKLDLIKEKLNKIKFKQFKLNLDKMGIFNSRVIWVGVNPANKVIELQQKIDSELLDLFSNDQEFKTHLTLARIKFIKDKTNFKKNLEIDINEKEFEVNEFCLVKSILSKDGSKYEVLERYILR